MHRGTSQIRARCGRCPGQVCFRHSQRDRSRRGRELGPDRGTPHRRDDPAAVVHRRLYGGVMTPECALPQWDGELTSVRYDEETNTWFIIAVHSTRLGPASGGTRAMV